jgi:hypothetical protein
MWQKQRDWVTRASTNTGCICCRFLVWQWHHMTYETTLMHVVHLLSFPTDTTMFWTRILRISTSGGQDVTKFVPAWSWQWIPIHETVCFFYIQKCDEQNPGVWGSEVLTLMVMKSSVFWGTTPRSLLNWFLVIPSIATKFQYVTPPFLFSFTHYMFRPLRAIFRGRNM